MNEEQLKKKFFEMMDKTKKINDSKSADEFKDFYHDGIKWLLYFALMLGIFGLNIYSFIKYPDEFGLIDLLAFGFLCSVIPVGLKLCVLMLRVFLSDWKIKQILSGKVILEEHKDWFDEWKKTNGQ